MPMFDVTQKLLDLSGKPLVGPPKPPLPGQQTAPPPEQMTLRSACVQALTAPNENQTGDEKFKNFCLAQRITERDNVALSAEEITNLKALTGAIFIPIVVGRVWEMLDPQPVAVEE